MQTETSLSLAWKLPWRTVPLLHFFTCIMCKPKYSQISTMTQSYPKLPTATQKYSCTEVALSAAVLRCTLFPLMWKPKYSQNYILILKSIAELSAAVLQCTLFPFILILIPLLILILILIFMLKSEVALSSAVLRCILFALGLIFSAACAVCASKQILIAHYQPFVTITFFSPRHKISSAKSRTFWWPMLKHVL